MLKKYQLKNGIKVILVESRKSPVLSIQMWVRTGSADERKGEEGLSHFIEHLVFKGTRKFGVGQIAANVEGAGGELNAYTSFDQTVFYVTISKEFQKVGLEVISEMMGFPTFDPKEVDNEREVVIEEIKRSQDSPHRQASRLLFETMYKGHPYSVPVIGFEENIRSVQVQKIRKFFTERYTPKNMTLLIVGDFKADDMKQLVASYFGKFKVTKLRQPPKRKSIEKRKRPAIVIKQAPFNETILHLAFRIPKATHKDIAALEVFALILGQGESSRLNRRLRMQQSLVNYAGSSAFVSKDPGFLAVSMSVSEADLTKALPHFGDELIKSLSRAPSTEEFVKAITNLSSEQLYQMETVDGLARNFGANQDLFNDPMYFRKFLKAVESLTPADMLKTARKYLRNSDFVIVLMSPNATPALEKYVNKWVSVLKTNLKSSKVLKSEIYGRGKRVNLSSDSTKLESDSRLKKAPLSNGIVAITRPSFETPVLSVRAAFFAGSRLEDQKHRGAVELLSRVWTSGARDMTEEQIAHKTDLMAANLGAFGGKNTQGISMTCLRAFREPMLNMFLDVLIEPSFSVEAIEREKKAMLEQLRLRKDNPSQICILQFLSALFGDHPYGRDPYGDEKSIRELNYDSVKDLFKKGTGLTFVASGALTREEFIGALEEREGLPVKEREFTSVKLAPLSDSKTLVTKLEKNQSHIVLGYRALDLKDSRRYALQVMQAVLAGQGGRLFVELRDKASLAYSVSPLRMEGLETGYFGAYIGCSPEKTEKAISMMKSELNRLCEDEVGDEELMRAKRYLIGRHDIDLQRNSHITSSILFDEIYGIPYDETYHFADRIRAVTAHDVRYLAQSLFAQPHVVSIVGPN